MQPCITMFDAEDAVQAIRDGRARAFRLACGLSLREAGNLIGVGRMTCYSWESSRRTPHPALAKAYVEALLRAMSEDAR
jgi:DNA-binding XRE family transcriptional regulator